MSPHHNAGLPTDADERDTLHQTQPTRDTHQGIHKSFVNIVIDNMTDDKVLNNRPHLSMPRKPTYIVVVCL